VIGDATCLAVATIDRAAHALTRRELLTGGAAAVLLAAAGCGPDESSAARGPTNAPSGRRVSHKYGSTQVPAAPERVVTVGLVDHDAALAVGVVPVAVTADAYSADQPHGIWPWAQDELGDATPEVLPFPEMSFERIARLDPDLILAVYSGITEQEYNILSQIAPTVAQSGDHGDYQAPWDAMTRVIGQALGRQDAAEDAITRVQQLFGGMRDQHPEFEGKSAVYAGFVEAGQYYAETQGSTRAAILTGLGFLIPDDIRGADFYAEVSREQVDLFDRDVLLWEVGDTAAMEAIQSDPLYARLDVAREGRDVFVTDPDLAGGLALISVLSLPYVVEQLVPRLAAAVDGNPATVVPD
jgi:iron complex transport system substrate-binding protein